jgi:hypothetical protein
MKRPRDNVINHRTCKKNIHTKEHPPIGTLILGKNGLYITEFKTPVIESILLGLNDLNMTELLLNSHYLDMNIMIHDGHSDHNKIVTINDIILMKYNELYDKLIDRDSIDLYRIFVVVHNTLIDRSVIDGELMTITL